MAARVFRLQVTLALVLMVAGIGLDSSRVSGQQERAVLALYYPWYNQETWSMPSLSDVPAIPYDGFDPEAIARHVGWAHGAGIDVLVSAWFGPTGDNVTEHNFRL